MVHIRRIALEPVHGLWQESEQIVRDDLIIYEIMVEKLEEEWWRGYPSY